MLHELLAPRNPKNSCLHLEFIFYLTKFGNTCLGGHRDKLSEVPSFCTQCVHCLMRMQLQMAMKLAPDRKKFMEVIGGVGDVNADMEKFCETFAPLLKENHKLLVRF